MTSGHSASTGSTGRRTGAAVFPLRQTVVGDSLRAGMGSNIEPSPTLFQGTMVGNGAQGQCEETRSISAITGLWPGASSSRWNSARVYWSGIVA